MDQADPLSSSILLVDDAEENVEILREILSTCVQGEIRGARGGAEALALLATFRPDLVLLDVRMPEMDGHRLFEAIREVPGMAAVPVIFVTAVNDTPAKLRAFRGGCVDYITKPFHAEELRARVVTHLRLRGFQSRLESTNEDLQSEVEAKREELMRAQDATILALTSLAESRDRDTGHHIERIRESCRLLASFLSRRELFPREIRGDFLDNIYRSSPLHDIGKVAIPDRILMKPGPLDADEFREMQGHSEKGAETLEAVRKMYPESGFLGMAIDIARHHHEKWDGTGYPCGLAGEAIPLAARIMTVIDVYDALRSTRCYKAAVSHPEALDIIRDETGTRFDPVIAGVFFEEESRFEEVFHRWRPRAGRERSAVAD